MKRPPLTVREVLRELRTQVRIYKTNEKDAGDVVTKAHVGHAIAALEFAIRFIRERQVTTGSLQKTLDQLDTVRKSARKHGIGT